MARPQGGCSHDPVALEFNRARSRYKIDLGPRELRQCSSWSEAAEAEGFEPPGGCPPLAFKASALDRSATLPIVHASGWPARAIQEAWSSTRCSATSASSLCGTAPRQTR